MHLQVLSGQVDRLDGIRQLVDVQHRHALQLRDPVQVVIIGQHRTAQLLGQDHQLVIHVARALDIKVADPERDARFLLQAVQDVQPAPAALALEPVGRIGDVLQLGQDERRHHHGGKDEARVRHIGDPAVDDDAGVQQHAAPSGRAFAPILDHRRRQPAAQHA